MEMFFVQKHQGPSSVDFEGKRSNKTVFNLVLVLRRVTICKEIEVHISYRQEHFYRKMLQVLSPPGKMNAFRRCCFFLCGIKTEEQNRDMVSGY